MPETKMSVSNNVEQQSDDLLNYKLSGHKKKTKRPEHGICKLYITAINKHELLPTNYVFFLVQQQITFKLNLIGSQILKKMVWVAQLFGLPFLHMLTITNLDRKKRKTKIKRSQKRGRVIFEQVCQPTHFF